MSNDLFSPNEEVKSFTWETKLKGTNQYSITLGLSSWSQCLLKALTAHWICSQVFAIALEGSNIFLLTQNIDNIENTEKWHPGVLKITESLLWCLLLFFFSEDFAALSWAESSFASLSAWFVSSYEQFIKIMLKEILRCVPSDVGHPLFSTFPNGAEVTNISSCRLETLHTIWVFRYIISFSLSMNTCALWDLA